MLKYLNHWRTLKIWIKENVQRLHCGNQWHKRSINRPVSDSSFEGSSSHWMLCSSLIGLHMTALFFSIRRCWGSPFTDTSVWVLAWETYMIKRLAQLSAQLIKYREVLVLTSPMILELAFEVGSAPVNNIFKVTFALNVPKKWLINRKHQWEPTLPVSAVLPANAEANDTTPPITGMSFERDNGAWAVVAAVLIPGVMRLQKRNESFASLLWISS